MVDLGVFKREREYKGFKDYLKEEEGRSQEVKEKKEEKKESEKEEDRTEEIRKAELIHKNERLEKSLKRRNTLILILFISLIAVLGLELTGYIPNLF